MERLLEHQLEVAKINREIELNNALHPVSREERIAASNRLSKALEVRTSLLLGDLEVLNEDLEDIDGLYEDLLN